MTVKAAIFGGSMNPPTRAHVAVAKQLRQHFGIVAVVPCGIRPDKLQTNVLDPAHRATMVRLAFGGLSVEIDLSDLERDQFQTTSELDARWKNRFGPDIEVWHVIGSDLIQGGGRGASQIQKSWHEGERIWNELNFVVIPRPGYPIVDEDLPSRQQALPALEQTESSSAAMTVFCKYDEAVPAGVP